VTPLPPWRLNLLRAAYAILAVGLGVEVWPLIPHAVQGFPLMRGVVTCMLAALGLLAVLGLRYPLAMLPLLLFELAWKLVWLGAVALPGYVAGRIDAATAETAFECSLIAIFLPLLPWDYLVANFVARAGDPWRQRPTGH
jgi:hypothetical protein